MLKIRKVVASDSELLLNWRNHPEVYKYALNPKPVVLSEHQRWFDKTLNNPCCVFFMGLLNDDPCGSVRYQLSEDMLEAEVSISVAPEYWGKGVASQMMNLAECELKKLTKVKVIHAVVLNANMASMRLFEKAQFVPEQTRFKKEI